MSADCFLPGVRKQTSGTCWFNGMVNSFILPQRMRQFVYNALGKYIAGLNRAQLLEFIRPQAPSCMSPAKPNSRIYYMKKIWGILYYTNPRSFNANTNRSTAFRSQQNIKNILKSLRGLTNTQFTTGYQVKDHLPEFLNRMEFKSYKMFGPNKSIVIQNATGNNIKGSNKQRDFIIRDFNYAVDTLPTNIAPNYFCESVEIFITNPNVHGGHAMHAICGYYCIDNGKYYIYDSNMNNPIECDWRNLSNVLSNQEYQSQSRLTYGYEWTEIHYMFAFYVNTNSSTKYNRHSDPLKIKPDAIKQRISNMTINNLSKTPTVKNAFRKGTVTTAMLTQMHNFYKTSMKPLKSRHILNKTLFNKKLRTMVNNRGLQQMNINNFTRTRI